MDENFITFYLFTVPVDHAARVMQVITWSSKGIPGGGKNDYEDNETLATVLDKLMAWEKKLYEEVKVHYHFNLLNS